jgi:hypothetical protein
MISGIADCAGEFSTYDKDYGSGFPYRGDTHTSTHCHITRQRLRIAKIPNTVIAVPQSLCAKGTLFFQAFRGYCVAQPHKLRSRLSIKEWPPISRGVFWMHSQTILAHSTSFLFSTPLHTHTNKTHTHTLKSINRHPPLTTFPIV